MQSGNPDGAHAKLMELCIRWEGRAKAAELRRFGREALCFLVGVGAGAVALRLFG